MKSINVLMALDTAAKDAAIYSPEADDAAYHELVQARAAVAELIAAATPFAALSSGEPTITIRTPDIARLRAALTRAT